MTASRFGCCHLPQPELQSVMFSYVLTYFRWSFKQFWSNSGGYNYFLITTLSITGLPSQPISFQQREFELRNGSNTSVNLLSDSTFGNYSWWVTPQVCYWCNVFTYNTKLIIKYSVLNVLTMSVISTNYRPLLKHRSNILWFNPDCRDEWYQVFHNQSRQPSWRSGSNPLSWYHTTTLHSGSNPRESVV